MSIPRRDFMKSLGVSIASILFTGGTQSNEKSVPQAFSAQVSSSIHGSKVGDPPSERFPASASLFPEEPTPVFEEVPTENPSNSESLPFNDPDLSPRARLRYCWFFLSWLARRYQEGSLIGEWARDLLITSHRAALVELIVAGKMSEVIARDVQRGFDAAVNHVHTSNAPMVCYD
jgi:hypothetical protein